jgi:prevent-host-death family protein
LVFQEAAMAMSLIEMRDNLAETINRVRFGGERIIIKRHGKNVAALVSVEDLAWLEELDEELDKKLAKQVRDRVKRGVETVHDWEDVKHEAATRKTRARK